MTADDLSCVRWPAEKRASASAVPRPAGRFSRSHSICSQHLVSMLPAAKVCAQKLTCTGGDRAG